LGIRPDWNGVDTWFSSRKRRSKPSKTGRTSQGEVAMTSPNHN